MFRKLKSIDVIVKTCAEVKAGQQVLVVVDDGARSIKIGQQVAEACNSAGAEVVMTIMAPPRYNGQEPPRTVAEAMQVSDIIFRVYERYGMTHTNAALAARQKGIRSVSLASRFGEEHFDREISLDDLKEIANRTERVAEMMTHANEARVTSSYGTDLKMSLSGRKGIAIHPLSGAAITAVPDYAEAAISPVEGSTEGTLVTEGGIRGWSLPLTEPLRLSIRKGKVSGVSGPEDYVERTKELLATDENVSNCAAELGIGTTHTMPKSLMSSSGVVLGTLHIAMGRNNDIGGQTYSKIHSDLMIYKPTLWVDEVCLIKDGQFELP